MRIASILTGQCFFQVAGSLVNLGGFYEKFSNLLGARGSTSSWVRYEIFFIWQLSVRRPILDGLGWPDHNDHLGWWTVYF